MHQVQRPQQTVQPREHAQVILGVAEVVFAQAFGVQPGVHITLEGQQRLLGVFRGEGRGPAAEARGIEASEFVGEVHQLADLRG
ncbi:hypothetical protein D9M71_396910 [compost metagenome]